MFGYTILKKDTATSLFEENLSLKKELYETLSALQEAEEKVKVLSGRLSKAVELNSGLADEIRMLKARMKSNFYSDDSKLY